MVAAVVRPALEAVRAAAPPGVEVRALGDDVEDADFLVPRWGEIPDLVPVAEWVVGALLGAATGLLEASRRRAWDEEAVPYELAGSTVVIVGYGSIGAAVRERLEPLGVEVVGVGRRELGELPKLLARADAVVHLAPLTDATRGSVDTRFLGAMRDGALFVNAGRGRVVDTDALLREVRSGRLRAVLDVTDPEPLPAAHPLWSEPGVLAITPHHAGDSVAADARAARFAGEQVGRFARGEPLHNVVGS